MIKGETYEARQASTNGGIRTGIDSGASVRSREKDSNASTGVNAGAAAPAEPDTCVGVWQGWRGWRVKKGRLTALAREATWEPGIAAVATCLHKPRSCWPGRIIHTEAIMGGLAFIMLGIMNAEWVPIATGIGMFVGLNRLAVLWMKVVDEAPHEAPSNHVQGPACGLYGLNEAKMLGKSRFFWMISMWARTRVLGRVSLWGRVIEHENGAIGQYAYPQSIEWISCIFCYKFVKRDCVESYEGYPACPPCNHPRGFWSKPRWLSRYTTLAGVTDLEKAYGLDRARD